MHVRPSQINPNAQMDALYAAERAAARREAESTRKKLLEFASELAGEAGSEEGCVVKLGAYEESEESGEHAEEKNQRGGLSKNKGKADSEDVESSISNWA
jgi:hypothetical protein